MSGTPIDQAKLPPSPASLLLPRVVLYLKGVAMGLGDAVPGVSGGTIAVITNIYDELIFSITAIDLAAVKLLFGGDIRGFWRHINGGFLLLIGLGILSGLLVSANTVLYLLANHFTALMGFFIGLVLASSWILKSQFNLKQGKSYLVLLLGMMLVGALSYLNPGSGELSYLYIFLSGVVAICAMILPGLSGAFILLLLGVLEFILQALVEINLPYIVVFLAGCAVGLLAFSRVLAWLLKNYHQLSYGFITGMLLGSILVLWPWQQTQSFYTDSAGDMHPLQSINVLPLNYLEITGNEPMLAATLICLLAGLVLVNLLHWVSNATFIADAESLD